MSIGGTLKTSNWYFVMNRIGWFFTRITFPLRSFSCFFFSRHPSTPASVPCSSMPSWVKFFSYVYRLPLSHTVIIAKYFFRVKITRRSDNFFTAEGTRFYNFICWFTMLVASLMIAFQGTVYFIKTHKCLKFITASGADFRKRVIFIFKSWHKIIISQYPIKINTIEIEEKYCQIAIKRLSQGVLPL